jgi:hypothetical protein
MRRALALAAALLAVACADTREKVSLDFHDEPYVTITTRSPLADTWEARFNRIEPSSERITIEKDRGRITAYNHEATVPVEDLAKFFSDVDLTMQITHGEGVSELTIYPGTSSRATRAERDEFERRVHAAAARYVDYVTAMRHLYEYLDTQPGRAQYVFPQLFVEEDEQVLAASEEENALILDARHAMSAVTATAPDDDAMGRFVDLAQRVNDPFPAVITIRFPRPFTSNESFKRIDDRTVRAEVMSAGEALGALEGKWLSPDPLAAILGRENFDPNEEAKKPRRAELSLTAEEVASAFTRQLRPKSLYRLRW